MLHVKIEISALKKPENITFGFLRGQGNRKGFTMGMSVKFGESILNTISDSNFQSLLHFRKSAIKELP